MNIIFLFYTIYIGMYIDGAISAIHLFRLLIGFDIDARRESLYT